MAENLYSKYRPLIFDEVFGHSKTITAFKERAQKESYPQALYIEGLTGTGKSTIANIVAKTILCKNKDRRGNPCNKCPECLSVIKEQRTSFFRSLNASNLGIDEMRELENFVDETTLSLTTQKVIIIDELQEISGSKAQKNILKLLEKIHEDTYFILLTMNGAKVDNAIKNRCVPYKLKPLEFSDIAGYLEYVCKKENISVDSEEKANVLITIADNSYGSMRTACSYLERVIDSNLWEVKNVISELNIISTSDLCNVINYILKGDMSCFSIKFEKEILDRIRYMLNLIYKFKNEVELTAYEKGQLNGIDAKCNINSVENTISELNELIKFPYLTQELIDFTIINIVKNNKEFVKISSERRRPTE